jgi:hypothetical protein
VLSCRPDPLVLRNKLPSYVIWLNFGRSGRSSRTVNVGWASKASIGVTVGVRHDLWCEYFCRVGKEGGVNLRNFGFICSSVFRRYCVMRCMVFSVWCDGEIAVIMELSKL